MDLWPSLKLPPINLWSAPWAGRAYLARPFQSQHVQRPASTSTNSPSHGQIAQLLKLR